MSSLILELQANALNSSVPVSDLIRKAYVAAIKLDISDFGKWLNNELNGYKKSKDIPDYRKINGFPKGHNPLRGWILVTGGNPEIMKTISSQRVFQPVGELEAVVKNNHGSLQLSFPPEVNSMISNWTGFETQYALFIEDS